MAHLIAQGDLPQQRWRRSLPEGRPVVLGRAAGGFDVPWDSHVSRRHAELTLEDERLDVRRIASSRNPIFAQGVERDAFTIDPGEHFVIGQTTFTLARESVDVSLQTPPPSREQTFSAAQLKARAFRDARQRIDVLSRLPEVIAGATSDEELSVRLVSTLLAGIPTADAVALIEAAPGVPIRVWHWDRRGLDAEPFRPSEKLIRRAVDAESSVLHLFDREADPTITAAGEFDWSFCSPVGGQGSEGWCLYVAGRLVEGQGATPSNNLEELLGDDLKFAEIVAAALRNLRRLSALERRQAVLRQFFSPLVLAALEDEDPEVALAPRQAEVTVMFCDLRGFSRASEQAAGDLLGLLDRVSRALGVTTHHILAGGGVVGDFQGDAVMGFWGWPLADPRQVERACRAALGIGDALDTASQRGDGPLAGFRLGIGIATGTAVAGKIGTADEVKVTVFGPVVNVASRLEGMTGPLGAPILLDGPTAEQVCERVPSDVAACRRVARVRPYGMNEVVDVHELLSGAPGAALDEERLARFATALAAFEAGDWQAARDALAELATTDGASRFLSDWIADRPDGPPADWDGAIGLDRK